MTLATAPRGDATAVEPGDSHRRPSPVRDERGLTLIELLVAMIILGILVIAALSTFLSQRVAGGDATAKEMAHSAFQAANTYVLDNGYSGISPSALKTVERTVNTVANGSAVLAAAAVNASSNGYTLAVVSSTANTFYVGNTNGTVSRTCIVSSGNGNTSTNTGGGCRGGVW